MYMPHTHTHTLAFPYVVALDPLLPQVRPAACVVLLLGLLSSLGERSLCGTGRGMRGGGVAQASVKGYAYVYGYVAHAAAQLLQLN